VDINKVIDQVMYIKATMNGVVQTPTGNFRIVSACMSLTFSTINAVGSPYTYQIPVSNQAALQTVFSLLASPTSQLTPCPLVFTMKNATDATITPSDITLDGSYPYNLYANINKVINQEMYIAVTMNGVA